MSTYLSLSIFNANAALFPDRRDRRNPRHPQVGRARAPDIANARSKLDRKPDPREERRRKERGFQIKILTNSFILIASNGMRFRIWLHDCIRRKREQRPVQIFNDKDYLKAIKVRCTV